MNLCVYAGEELAKYGFGEGHPFSTKRHAAFWDEFCQRKLNNHPAIELYKPVTTDEQMLLRFHTTRYVKQVKQQSQTGEGFLDAGDTPAFPGVYESACYVVGSVVDAVDQLMQKKFECGFVPIAGLHHARRDSAAGFCVFNDCGIAIEYLKSKYQLTRIAYVDIDAHHGDGVFYAFEDDPTVIFADVHEDGRYLYPGTGAESETGSGKALGVKRNIAMPMYADDESFITRFDEIIPFLEKQKPQLIILQCGADSLAGDPITHLQYSDLAHKHAAELLRKVADNYNAPILALGGGGYNLENIKSAWCGVIESLVA